MSTGSTGFALMIPNLADFVPMTIAFIILWIIFAKFVYPVVMGMIDKRAQTIKDNLEDAEASKIESARLLEQRQTQLEDAKAEAAKIIEDAKAQGEAVKAKVIDEAHAEAKVIIDKANETAQAQVANAAKELQTSVADMSVLVASKVIGQDLSDAEHRALVEKYVEEAGSLHVA